MIGKLFTYIGEFLLCILIPPLGVLKIAHRQMKNKQKLVKGGEQILVISGLFMIVFFIRINDAALISNPFTYLYGSAGVLGIIIGILMVLRGIKYTKYKSAVENNNLYTVNNIAKVVKLPEETIIKDLLQMITYGFFPELKFDPKAKTLKPNDSAMANIMSRAVECNSCGATVTVFDGKQNKCEYCGEALNFDDYY